MAVRSGSFLTRPRGRVESAAKAKAMQWLPTTRYPPRPRMTTDPLACPDDSLCISLIGMPGAGKSAVGARVAEALGWAHVDTDYLIEATYGVRLQVIADALDKERFLDVEAAVIGAMRMQRTVISTGGSVVYRAEAMRWLASLGPVIHLDAPLPLLLERIARNPDRGIAIAPGQTIDDLLREREALYRQWATHSVPVAGFSIVQCADAVLAAVGRLA